MAMATTASLTPTPSLWRSNWLQSLRPQQHHAKAFAQASLLRSISAKMQDQKPKHQQLVTSGLLAGAFFAALATSETASAAQQVMELAAENDSRGLALLVPLVPAIGWVLYNILQPALNQLDRMKSAKGLAIGLGLGGSLASLGFAQHASAAGDIAAAADSDSRGLVLLGVLIPAIGWVLFNILQPGLNQLDKMRSSSKAVLVGALGLGAGAASYALLPAQAQAAAQEVATIAEGDNRGLLLLLVIAPAIGWVLFNILQPALNQLNRMNSEK